jgi:hypothetical protein
MPLQTGSAGSAGSSSPDEDGAAAGTGEEEAAGNDISDSMRRLMEMTNLPETYARALLEAHNGDLEAVVARIMDD